MEHGMTEARRKSLACLRSSGEAVEGETNYNASTLEGRRNILIRIFADSDLEFSDALMQNCTPWVDRLFNGGRSYQRVIDKENIDIFFKKQAGEALGFPSRHDAQVPYSQVSDSR